MRVAAPSGYEPNQLIVKSAVREAQKSRRLRRWSPPIPMEAVQGADVVYTDVWTSMGQEEEAETAPPGLPGIHGEPGDDGGGGAGRVFMHCLPAHRGEEVAAEVIDGPQSIVFDQVENRLHVQKAILILLMGGSVAPERPSTLRA
jgi:ornithine carbamoyltransferase